MASIENIFDVHGFLRWAAANQLMGAWDNYYATPSNFYLYNSGKKGGKDEFMEQPYFHFVPHDYDHTFGIDYFGIQWQYHDITDWADETDKAQGEESDLPMVRLLLLNDQYRAYYYDYMAYLLDTTFNSDWYYEIRGDEGDGGLWDKIRMSAYLESDCSWCNPHTGRTFTNDQVYWNGFVGYEFDQGFRFTNGIQHYFNMRNENARWQLEGLTGQSGVTFPVEPTELPDYIDPIE
jgi:hypothetical protein